eukprot:4406408-Alexandrium_andersonii.AAC.1
MVMTSVSMITAMVFISPWAGPAPTNEAGRFPSGAKGRWSDCRSSRAGAPRAAAGARVRRVQR